MSSKAVKRLLKNIKETNPLAADSIEELRAKFEKFYLQFHTHQTSNLNEFKINDIPSFWISSPNSDENKILLFFHGGGFTIGSTKDHFDLCARLSRASEARVLSIDYRLAPENPFPAALEDCIASYNWLLKEGFEQSQIVPVGISSGGTLVISTLLSLRGQGIKLPHASCCMSPAVDLLFEGDSVNYNERKDWVTKGRLSSVAINYLAGQDPKQPLASPLYADLRGLPSLMIQVGSHEILLDDNLKFYTKAKDAGVNVTLEIWDGMLHCWQVFASEIPEGQQAIESMGKFLKAKLSPFE